MYDYELENYLREKGWKLSNKEYIYICNTCPQLDHIKYNAFENIIEAWSNCSYFRFQVYLKTD